MTAVASIVPFDLRHLCAEVMNDTDLADPHDIADEVLSRIEAHQTRDALEQSVYAFVRQLVSSQFIGEQASGNQSAGAAPKAPPAQTASRPAVGLPYHKKWPGLYRRRFHDKNGRWILLGDATVADLRAAAECRRIKGAETLASAARHDDLADYMDAHGHVRVSEVPEAVVRAKLD